MRRFVMVVGLLGAAGCSNFRDLFSTRADMAAEAGDQQLKSERLAQLMTAVKGFRPSREAATFLANVWTDYSLFAQAAAGPGIPMDSTTIAQVMWPEIAELRGTHWHDTLMARRAAVDSSAARAAYEGDNVRLFQHILVTVQPTATPEVRTAARKRAEQALARVKGGAAFGEVAAEMSQDPASRADAGYLPPGPKGRWVTAFDSAGWSLAPGGLTGIVETPFGYHIIRRPPLDEAEPRMAAFLAEDAGRRLDSVYMDSLAVVNKLEVSPRAPKAMRAALEDPENARKSRTKLSNFKGGGLTVSEYLRWVQALPPPYQQQIRQAEDSVLKQFARVLSQNVLLLRQADSAKIEITPAEWQGMTERYRGQVDTLKTEMGLTGEVTDSALPAAEREKVAALKVEQYFDRAVAGQVRLRPLPATLGRVLRDRGDYEINTAGITRSVELAEATRQKEDSAGGGGVRPAPGPAPVPGPGAAPTTTPPPADSARRPSR